MSVYVDDMKASFGRMIMCHMIATDEDELHEMAARIGVDRKWFQRKASGDHYDIALSKRRRAVRLGAIEITQRQCAAMCYIRRHKGFMPKPDAAEAMMVEDMENWRRLREAVADL